MQDQPETIVEVAEPDKPLSDEEIAALCVPVAKAASRVGFWRFLLPHMLIMLLMNSIVAYCVYAEKGRLSAYFCGTFIWASITPVVFYSLSLLFVNRRANKRSLTSIAEVKDVRTLPTLLKAACAKGFRVAPAVRKALLVTLSELKASDSSLLDKSKRSDLRRLLHSREKALVLAVLKALEQVGNREDVKAVERLAQGRGLAAQEKDVQEAAQHCLEFLEVEGQKRRDSQILLRPAQDDGRAADVLLRPTTAVSDTAPQILLRPAEQINHAEQSVSLGRADTLK